MPNEEGSAGQAPSIAQQIQTQQQKLLELGEKLGNFDRVREREFYSTYLFTPGKAAVVQPQRVKLFVATAGQTGQGYANMLTERETNWAQSQKLSDQQNLVVKALHVSIQRAPVDPQILTSAQFAQVPQVYDPTIPLHPTDVESIAKGTVLEVEYLTEKIPMGLIADFPEVGGIWSFREAARQWPAPAQAPAPIVQTVGLSETLETPAGDEFPAWGYLPISRQNVAVAFERRFRVPLMLQHGEQFNINLNIPVGWQMAGASPLETAGFEEGRDATGMFEIRVGMWCTESFVEQS